MTGIVPFWKIFCPGQKNFRQESAKLKYWWLQSSRLKIVKVLAILRLLTNEEIQKVIGKEMDLRELHDYYKVPVMCLLRIKESVDT